MEIKLQKGCERIYCKVVLLQRCGPWAKLCECTHSAWPLAAKCRWLNRVEWLHLSSVLYTENCHQRIEIEIQIKHPLCIKKNVGNSNAFPRPRGHYKRVK